jgi:hypothetical protein
LEFYREKLEYNADRESATDYLNRIYRKYLPASLLDAQDEGDQGSEDDYGEYDEHRPESKPLDA